MTYERAVVPRQTRPANNLPIAPLCLRFILQQQRLHLIDSENHLHLHIHTYKSPTATATHATMHRTYSMRQSRAPTASQIQNPPPPASSTKSGRFFGKSSLGEFLCFQLPSKIHLVSISLSSPQTSSCSRYEEHDCGVFEQGSRKGAFELRSQPSCAKFLLNSFKWRNGWLTYVPFFEV